MTPLNQRFMWHDLSSTRIGEHRLRCWLLPSVAETTKGGQKMRIKDGRAEQLSLRMSDTIVCHSKRIQRLCPDVPLTSPVLASSQVCNARDYFDKFSCLLLCSPSCFLLGPRPPILMSYEDFVTACFPTVAIVLHLLKNFLILLVVEPRY